MENTIIEFFAREGGESDVLDVHGELLFTYFEPKNWMETGRKVQQMRLRGQI